MGSMQTCGSCRRHVRLAALVCPFCAIAISLVACHRGTVGADAGPGPPIAVYGGPPVAVRLPDGGLVSTGAVYGGPPIAAGPPADVMLSPDPTASPADQRILASLRSGFTSCASSALATDPTETGSLQIAISVDPKGDVTSAAATKVSGLSGADVSCMQNRSRNASFDPGAARTLTVAVTVTLAKKE